MPTETKTTCPYCGVGCGVIARVDDDGTVSVKGDPDHPANFGRLCSKGSALAETLGQQTRLLYPEIHGRRAEWDEALDLVAKNFQQAIAEHGPDSVAFYVSGQFLTEDYYVANKLMKGFIGSGNIDTNSRLCMASSVAGHRRAFGTDTVPGGYEDIELADLVILVGSNLAWCHPVLYQRLAAAKAKRSELKVVTVDIRHTMTADIADMNLLIKPDGDVALFNGLLVHLAQSPALDRGYIDAHTVNFTEACNAARAQTIMDVADATGLTIDELLSFYRLFEATQKVVTCYSQGVNQSVVGTDKVNAIINCHLARGLIGKPGMGPFSLTGQPNAMGGREVGGLANMLAAHMDIEDVSHRDIVSRFWRAPNLGERPGLKAVDMFRAVEEGKIKALWIMATNPVVSMPDADRVRRAIANCPFVVVSDIERNTDTTELAHVLLPATGWGEKDGTVTNSERRISRQRTFLSAPGDARADWWQLTEVAKRLGYEEAFDYASPAEIFAEHAALSGFENNGSRAFDISRHAQIDRADYDALSPFQWPAIKENTNGTSRFFANGRFFTEDRRACFVPLQSRPSSRNNAYPFVLNTGRIRDQWHTMTRTGKAAKLSAHYGEPFAEINPRDALTLGINDADIVKIHNEYGAITVRALLTDRQPRGGIFVPMHWNGQFAAAARVDSLFASVVDPVSGQPALKQTGVLLEKCFFGAYGFAVSRTRPQPSGLPYWALAKTEGGWRTELAWNSLPDGLEEWCRRDFALPEYAEMLHYHDRQTGDSRVAFFADDSLLLALFIARNPVSVSRNWAVSLLASSYSEARRRYSVLAGRPGEGGVDPGATVCSCFNVGINQITKAISAGCHSIEAIGKCLNAGTNCGSCRAEIRIILDQSVREAAE